MHTSKLDLFQYDDGYRYNSDSLFLYSFFKTVACKGKLLDVGAGCGILGLLAKRDFPSLDVELLDIQAKNVVLCEKNASINGLHVKVEQGDFLELKSRGYDVIISNPPFYHEGSKRSENGHLAKSRYNTNLPFDEFAKKCYKALVNRGKFLFCYDAKQLVSVLSVLKNERFGVEKMRFIHSKKEKEASLVLILAIKNSKGLTHIQSPLFVNDDKGYLDEAKEIFSMTNTMSKTWKS